MSPTDRQNLVTRYESALAAETFDAMESLWREAETDAEIEAVLCEVSQRVFVQGIYESRAREARLN